MTSEPGEPVYGTNASGKRKARESINQAGPQADAVDLAGIGDGRLDCTVDTPLKENDGTKDAYVSYLVTTRVCHQAGEAHKDHNHISYTL